ncbi:MAG: lipoprotein-releasing ABC transporter permease subunit [Candidatus Glassbacteria bacterium]|nr:lipoprotein-releasing ABC transporter permease subunit [Candidatus Glassbacteria bacterium]
MRVDFFIALRYLTSRRSSLLSLFTLISICGVFVGVMALIVILAVLNGFHEDLKDKILGTMPHVTILTYNGEPIEHYDSLIAEIARLPEVSSAAPLVYSEGMVVSDGQHNIGTILRGIDPGRENSITEIGENMISGGFVFTDNPVEGETAYPGIVIGSYMAQVLHVGVGDVVTVWAPRGVKITPFGLSAPWRKFRVLGIFETGLFDVDSKFAYLSLEQAQSFFGMKNAVSHLEIRLVDVEQAYDLRERIVRMLGGYPFTGTDWLTYNRNLFEALKLEKAVMFVILTLIVLVAAFNIVSTLTLLVMDKTREIGILRSMGLTARSVGLIFVFDGMVIGLIGTVLGAAAGWLVSTLLAEYQWISIPGDVYFISEFPVRMQAGDFGIVTAASVLISLAATVYPAFRAARLLPVDAIRYE